MSQFFPLFFVQYVADFDCTPHSVWKVMIFDFSDSLYNVILFIRLRFVNGLSRIFFYFLVHFVYTAVLFLFVKRSHRVTRFVADFRRCSMMFIMESILWHLQEIQALSRYTYIFMLYRVLLAIKPSLRKIGHFSISIVSKCMKLRMSLFRFLLLDEVVFVSLFSQVLRNRHWCNQSYFMDFASTLCDINSISQVEAKTRTDFVIKCRSIGKKSTRLIQI